MDVGDDRAPSARREDVSLPAAHDRPSARIVGTDCDIACIQVPVGSDGFSLEVKDAVEPRVDIPIGELHALFGFGFPIGRVAALFHFFRLQDGRAVIISDGKDGRLRLIRLTSRKCSHAQHQNKCHGSSGLQAANAAMPSTRTSAITIHFSFFTSFSSENSVTELFQYSLIIAHIFRLSIPFLKFPKVFCDICSYRAYLCMGMGETGFCGISLFGLDKGTLQ